MRDHDDLRSLGRLRDQTAKCLSAKTDVLGLDDWGMAAIDARMRRDLLSMAPVLECLHSGIQCGYYVDTHAIEVVIMSKQARLFTHGGSQAVRLPAEFRFTDVDAVFVRRNAAGEVVLSRQAPRPYAEFMAERDALGPLPDAFLLPAERSQHRETRDPFSDIIDETEAP